MAAVNIIAVGVIAFWMGWVVVFIASLVRDFIKEVLD